MRWLRPIRVLIVDDHDAILRGVRNLIEGRDGFNVVGTARDGREALDLIQELNPHITVLDYALPEMNGLDLAWAIKRSRLDTEILIFSMYDREELISDLLRAGVRSIVLKGDAEEHLLAALDALSTGKPYFSPTVSDAILNQFLETSPRPVSTILTPRERQVVQLIAEGHLNKQMAGDLAITIKTIETHRSKAMRKLKARTTADVVRWALRNHLAQP
jgi:DNA-binding NarL/FixJ family response regulator